MSERRFAVCGDPGPAEEPDRTTVHDVIYQELVRGVVSERSKADYLDIIERLVERGAQGVIAGCTEIELLIAQSDIQVPLFRTAYLHAVAAADFALSDGLAQPPATGPGE